MHGVLPSRSSTLCDHHVGELADCECDPERRPDHLGSRHPTSEEHSIDRPDGGSDGADERVAIDLSAVDQNVYPENLGADGERWLLWQYIDDR